MIILGAKSEGGNAIHLITGPESDLFMDIHGAMSVDIDAMVRAIGTDRPLSLMVTRCRSELDLAKELDRRGIPYTAAAQSCGKPESAVKPAAQDDDKGPDLSSIIRRELPDRQRKG